METMDDLQDTEALCQKLKAGHEEGVPVAMVLNELFDYPRDAFSVCASSLRRIEPCCKDVVDLCRVAQLWDYINEDREFYRVLKLAESRAESTQEFLAIAKRIVDGVYVYGVLWNEVLKSMMSSALKAINSANDWCSFVRFSNEMCKSGYLDCSEC